MAVARQACALALAILAVRPVAVDAARTLGTTQGSSAGQAVIYHNATEAAGLSEWLEGEQQAVPEFTVDLRKPPKERWAEVVEHFRAPMQKLLQNMGREIDDAYGPFAGAFAGALDAPVADAEVAEEICGIAEMLEVDCGSLQLIQVLYEVHAACTSVGVILPSGPALARTMDWEEPFLKKLTTTIHFVGGPFPFSASTWAGYVGVLTGTRHATEDADGLAVSVNFRLLSNDDSHFAIAARKMARAKAGAMPVGFLVRRALEEQSYGRFEDALGLLKEHDLISPVYFTVAATRPRFQALLDSYAADYSASYDPDELRCCCRPNTKQCSLVGRRDLELKGPEAICPEMQLLGSSGPERLVEDPLKCAHRPTAVAECALQANEVAVITRNGEGAEEVRRLTGTVSGAGACEPHRAAKFLIQANHDSFAPIERGTPLSPDGASQDIFGSLRRLKEENQYLANAKPLQDNVKLERLNLDETEFLFSMLTQVKVLNDHTVYGTAMRPAVGAIETRVPWPCGGGKRKKGGKRRGASASKGLCLANQKMTMAYSQGFE